MSELVAHEPKLQQALTEAIAQDKSLLPVHPWQWSVMSSNPSIEQYLKTGRLNNLGQIGSAGINLFNRSLYAPSPPYAKFSLMPTGNSIQPVAQK